MDQERWRGVLPCLVLIDSALFSFFLLNTSLERRCRLYSERINKYYCHLPTITRGDSLTVYTRDTGHQQLEWEVSLKKNIKRKLFLAGHTLGMVILLANLKNLFCLILPLALSSREERASLIEYQSPDPHQPREDLPWENEYLKTNNWKIV